MPAFDELVALCRKLRSPGGCAWDRKQTLASIRKHVREEVAEFFEAMDEKDAQHMQEELGDVLYTLIFLADIAENQGLFSMEGALRGAREKLIRRHPHVFGHVKVRSVRDIMRNWKRIKAAERAAESGFPRGRRSSPAKPAGTPSPRRAPRPSPRRSSRAGKRRPTRGAR